MESLEIEQQKKRGENVLLLSTAATGNLIEWFLPYFFKSAGPVTIKEKNCHKWNKYWWIIILSATQLSARSSFCIDHTTFTHGHLVFLQPLPQDQILSESCSAISSAQPFWIQNTELYLLSQFFFIFWFVPSSTRISHILAEISRFNTWIFGFLNELKLLHNIQKISIQLSHYSITSWLSNLD